MLGDREQAAADDLPSTGLPADWERVVSAPFIVNERYGTRCSSVLLVERNGRTILQERRFDASGVQSGNVALRIHEHRSAGSLVRGGRSRRDDRRPILRSILRPSRCAARCAAFSDRVRMLRLRCRALRRTRCRGALLLAFCIASRRSRRSRSTIPEVSEPIENNIRAFLSLTRYAERNDITPEMMSRLQRRIVDRNAQALEPLGYYEPEVSIRRRAGRRRQWNVTIHVTPGRPVRLSEVSVDMHGPGASERALREHASNARSSSPACASITAPTNE